MPRGRAGPVHPGVGVLDEGAVGAVRGVLIALKVVGVDHGVGSSYDLLDLEIDVDGPRQRVQSRVLHGHVDPSCTLANLGLTGSGVVRSGSNRHPGDADVLVVQSEDGEEVAGSCPALGVQPHGAVGEPVAVVTLADDDLVGALVTSLQLAGDRHGGPAAHVERER